MRDNLVLPSDDRQNSLTHQNVPAPTAVPADGQTGVRPPREAGVEDISVLLTTNQVGSRLGITAATVRLYITTGQLAAVALGTGARPRHRISEQVLRDYIARHERPSVTPPIAVTDPMIPLSMRDAAQQSGICLSTLYRWMAHGYLLPVDASVSIQVRIGDIEAARGKVPRSGPRRASQRSTP